MTIPQPKPVPEMESDGPFERSPVEDWELAEIRKGQADIEAGRVVPHEEVGRWLDSLDTDSPLPPPLDEA